MNDRFKFRTPIYGPDREFKDLIYWNAEEGAPAISGRGGCVFKDPEQCTGLKDKNGRLVYEGDIVRLTRRKDNILQKRGSCFTVRYLTHRFCGFGYGVNNRSVDMCLTESKAKCLEVIGNIHENADLLKEKSEKPIL